MIRRITYCCITLIAIFFSAAAMAQGSLSGKLVDGQDKPVSYATVTLFRGDSSVVNGALSDDQGKFTIENTQAGTYKLRVSAIGFTERNIPGIQITADAPNKNLGPIKLTANAQALKEVTITGERALMEMSVDKKTFNVEKNLTSAGGSASDVLQNVPSVSVDADGNVSLRGKGGVTILIDGKPSTLFGGDAASALQSMSANSIESVEVITNPSAKYDAQGTTGIINIITKKDKKFGFNGSVTAGAGTKDKYNGSLSLNARNRKWNFFLNSSNRLNPNTNVTTTNIHRFTNDTASNVYESYIRQFNGSFNTIGAEYTIDKHNSVTLTENINLRGFKNAGYADYITNAGSWNTNRLRYAENAVSPSSISSSLDYKHTFSKKKEELTANITAVKTFVKRTQTYTTIDTPANFVQSAPSTGSNASINGQVDYTTPFMTKTGKLDAGLKTQLTFFESSNNPYKGTAGNLNTFDVSLYNAYKYNQQIHAAYVSYSDQKGKWSYQGGLRAEDAIYTGNTDTINTVSGARNKGKEFTNSFFNFFPSVFFSYQLPKQQSIYLSYTRRTNRPDFRQLLPYYDISNPQDTTSGNPNLQPEFINNTELSYNKTYEKGHNIILSTYYLYTQNIIQSYRRSNAENTNTFTRPENLNYGITYGVELIAHAQITKAWEATANFNYFQNEINGDNLFNGIGKNTLNNSGNSWFGKVNTSVKLPMGFSLQVNGNYEAPKAVAQGNLKESYWVDVAVRKNLWKGKGNIVLNVSDIFDTHKYTTTYGLDGYNQMMYRNRETRIGNLTFTYRFGKTPDNSKQGGMGGGGRRGNRNADKEKSKNNPETKDREGNLKSDEGGGGGEGQPGNGPKEGQSGGGMKP
jgi:iron complex outermembrane recepter protein